MASNHSPAAKPRKLRKAILLGIIAVLLATYAFAVSDEKVSIAGDNMTGPLNATKGINASAMNISGLAGTGNDYVCVDNTGALFRSDAAC